MQPGFFDNTVKAEWLQEGRVMRLLQPVSFSDIHGTIWEAPAGSMIDGASIPRFFWRVIGSPFSGKYRRASVIHDVYCKQTGFFKVPWRCVHKMFHEAMLADGVPRFKAWLMYQAVYHFGPRW